MGKIFHYENPVWMFLGKLVDFVVLTGLWLICSVPVITIGASTKALYAVSMRLSKNEEGYIIPSFFKEMKEGFLSSTLLGLLVLAIGAFLASDLYVYWHMANKAGAFLFAVFFILTVLYLLTVSYLFPMMAATGYRGKQVLMAAFVTAMKNPGWALLMILVMACVLAVGIFILAPVLVIGIGFAAYIQCKITTLVMKHYHIKSDLQQA